MQGVRSGFSVQGVALGVKGGVCFRSGFIVEVLPDAERVCTGSKYDPGRIESRFRVAWVLRFPKARHAQCLNCPVPLGFCDKYVLW